MSVKLNITRRFTFIYFVLVLFGVAVVVALVGIVIDGKQNEDTARRAREMAYKTVDIAANRGNILAHDGRLLATTIIKYRLYTDLNAVGLHDTLFRRSVDTLARGLSRILNEKSEREYAKELRADRQKAVGDATRHTHRYRPLVNRDVDYAELKQLSQLPLLRNRPNRGGLMNKPQIRRLHPYEAMARNTVGRTYNDGSGITGIEHAYNHDLAGKPGREVRHQATGKNVWIPVSSTPQVEPVDGCDIVTTLDVDLQEMAETVVAGSLQKNPDLEWGAAVIMEVTTGEVRAIANKRKRRDGSITEDENYALRYRKDPGSTFKLASFMIMLEKGLSLTDSVDTGNGTVRLYDKLFEDEGSKGGMLSLQEAFEKSSNVGTINLSNRIYKSKNSEKSDFINKKDFSERIDALKLKEVSLFDLLPNQRIEPVIHPVSQFSGLTLAMMSIGYELEITPLQTLALYNAVANDGVMVHPKFIKELRRENRTIKTFPPQVVHASICSKPTLEKLHQMLLGVVEQGSARRARSDLFRIAGKTGTAHIAEGQRGYTNQKLSSFVGYFPADAPKYSCIVTFKTYNTGNKAYGGAIAAPVFKEIAEKVYARSITWHKPVGEGAAVAEAPYTKSGSYEKLHTVLA
ncbi:MAG: penicillin-binding protein 2, partial [Prevotellaceae bacterium]|nr:penicillin-binding protein 2 [Prevotellaceae bacterium]